MTNIYVLAKDGSPIAPMHSYGRAKRFIKQGKAVIAEYVPFTIQLTYDVEEPVVPTYTLGIDPGRTNIGVCVNDENDVPVFAAKVITRNKEIRRLMEARKAARQASRRGERKARQRRASAQDKTGKQKMTEYLRLLPGCEEYIRCKVIRNTEARFIHRKVPNGKLTPTANQLLQTHLNLVDLVARYLPIAKVVVEVNRFDFARMENPNIQNWEYQKGKLFGYNSVEDAVSDQQNGKCLLCGRRKIDHCHHVVPRHLGGSESIDNRAGLCTKCHDAVHTDAKAREKLAMKKEGLNKKHGALSVINQIMPKLLLELADRYTTYVTTGFETRKTRDSYPGLAKDHHIDAWCIAMSMSERKAQSVCPVFDDVMHIMKQFRRHDRAIIKYQRERRYYLDDKLVAANRRKRTSQTDDKKATPQKEDSLHEWYLRTVEEKGAAEAKRLQSKLKVVKSTRVYNDMQRDLPGAIFLHQNKRYVLTGRLTGGKYYRAEGYDTKNFPARDCKIVAKNAGLVFVN